MGDWPWKWISCRAAFAPEPSPRAEKVSYADFRNEGLLIQTPLFILPPPSSSREWEGGGNVTRPNTFVFSPAKESREGDSEGSGITVSDKQPIAFLTLFLLT
jgi:hypothetical protein